ncbi:hypothetical protein ABT065_14345 [Streptomyces sp. NPDC002764]|uniref:hypothetical protein n=1 Tax=Streptomyces sp. NPDC002764 TaxID=3154428 RepID=UPI0033310A6E
MTDAVRLYGAVQDRLRADGHPTLTQGTFVRLVSAAGFPLRHIRDAEGFRRWRAFEHITLVEP